MAKKNTRSNYTGFWSREYLVGLLHDGMNSHVSEFSDDIVEQMRQEVGKRLAQELRRALTSTSPLRPPKAP